MGRDESMGRRAGAARSGALRPARMNEHKHGHAGGGGFGRICLVRAGDLNVLFPAGEVGGVEPVEDGGGGGGAGAGEKAGRWCLIGVVSIDSDFVAVLYVQRSSMYCTYAHRW